MINRRSRKETISLAAIAVIFFISIALMESAALETNTDRPGMDYSNFDLASANPSLCEQACNADPNCRAFTYVKPGYQGSNARCWLKNDIPTATPNNCCDSGVKGSTGVSCPSGLPNPQLALVGTESNTYLLAVVNRAAYPSELFQSASDLPPCGSNTNAARTWVDIYDQNDNRIYGFCSLGSPADLGDLWFAVAQGATPPLQVYIVMEDRRCGKTYRSNSINIPASGTYPGGTSPSSIDLTGEWSCDDGGLYYLRQFGTTVWWYGEHDPNAPDWSNVMRGTISGSTINADWTDVPKGSVMQFGNLKLQIVSNNKIVAISKTGGFAGSTWTR